MADLRGLRPHNLVFSHADEPAAAWARLDLSAGGALAEKWTEPAPRHRSRPRPQHQDWRYPAHGRQARPGQANAERLARKAATQVPYPPGVTPKALQSTTKHYKALQRATQALHQAADQVPDLHGERHPPWVRACQGGGHLHGPPRLQAESQKAKIQKAACQNSRSGSSGKPSPFHTPL